MPQFHARVDTPRASRNMTRLFKHFAHKREVRAGEHHAQAVFAFGECRMFARSGPLLIDCQAGAGKAEQRLRCVIADHVHRFSGDEALQVEWQDGPLVDAPAEQRA